jgi:hypothetical protein
VNSLKRDETLRDETIAVLSHRGRQVLVAERFVYFWRACAALQRPFR